MQSNPTEDVVNKVSRMYEMLDRMTRLGQGEEMEEWKSMFLKTIGDYNHQKPAAPAKAV